MNPFKLLFLPLPNILIVFSHQNDKIRVYSTYLPKIFFVEEQPMISRWKIHFDKIKRSTRINLDIPPEFCEPHPHDRITPDEEEYETISSSYHMNIIGQTPNKFNMDFVDGDFKSVNQESFDNTYGTKSNNDDLDVIFVNVIYI